jgi:hypothetical protein
VGLVHPASRWCSLFLLGFRLSPRRLLSSLAVRPASAHWRKALFCLLRQVLAGPETGLPGLSRPQLPERGLRHRFCDPRIQGLPGAASGRAICAPGRGRPSQTRQAALEWPRGVMTRRAASSGVPAGSAPAVGLDVPVADRTQGSMALLDGLIEAPGSHLRSLPPSVQDRSRRLCKTVAALGPGHHRAA